jgi:hypothetical protein
MPERASAAAASLQGRLRARIRRGGGGGKARNTGAWERNLSITIPESAACGSLLQPNDGHAQSHFSTLLMIVGILLQQRHANNTVVLVHA